MADQRASYECPACHKVSWNPNDVLHGYCGACQDFTRPQRLWVTIEFADGDEALVEAWFSTVDSDGLAVYEIPVQHRPVTQLRMPVLPARTSVVLRVGREE